MSNPSEEIVVEIDNTSQTVVVLEDPNVAPDVIAEISESGLPGRDGAPGPTGPAGPPGSAADAITRSELEDHKNSKNPHPVYDDGASYFLLYANAKV